MYRINENKYINEWKSKSKPTAGVLWTNIENSSPIEDLRAWQADLGNYYGIFGNVIEFSNRTFKMLCESKERYKLAYSRIYIPSDLINLLWSNADPIINNNLQDGKVIIKSVGEYLPVWYTDLEATVF
jgi:hypothetical protein